MGEHADVRINWAYRIFNTGSPRNVIAGWGGGNVDQVIAKYEKEHRELEEKKVRKLVQRREEAEEARRAQEALKKGAR